MSGKEVLQLPLRPTAGDSEWFVDARFGMFIHWGLYALPARHEWVKQHERLTNEDYQKYFDHFDPDLYDPKAWAKAAKAAGMRYFVITTKHHDGFCLWDSDLTDYKATNTPYGKDLIAPMVEAFREEGLKIGFYHSLIDWHHEDFVIDNLHALRDHPDRDKLNVGRDQSKYAAYLRGQVRELLTRYGKIDLIWFDFSYPTDPPGQTAKGKGHQDWESEELIKMVRELQPHILVDDRLDLNGKPYGWDFTTPEQFQPEGWKVINGERITWEACQTFSGSWGYHRDEQTWKSVDQLLRMLIDNVSKGGNLLLNVGPTARGEFDYRALDRLSGMGEWMKRHARSIYGCTMAPEPFETPDDCRLTYNPTTKRLYVHVFAWPFETIVLNGFGDQIKYAQLLNDASEVKFEKTETGATRLRLPVVKPNVEIPVVEIFLR